MADTQQPQQSGENQPSFQIEKIYVKDLSLEIPNAPMVYGQQSQPQIEVQHATAEQHRRERDGEQRPAEHEREPRGAMLEHVVPRPRLGAIDDRVVRDQPRAVGEDAARALDVVELEHLGQRVAEPVARRGDPEQGRHGRRDVDQARVARRAVTVDSRAGEDQRLQPRARQTCAVRRQHAVEPGRAFVAPDRHLNCLVAV